MKKILVIVGHSRLKSGVYTSANGYVNEYKYNKALAPKVKKYIEKYTGKKVDVLICPEKVFKTSKEEYSYKVPRANNGQYELIIELHLNAFDKESANGTEVCYYPNSKEGKATAQAIQDELKKSYTDRGIKARSDLYILRDTKPVAVLIESFFCTNKADCKKLSKTNLSKAIARGVNKYW